MSWQKQDIALHWWRHKEGASKSVRAVFVTFASHTRTRPSVVQYVSTGDIARFAPLAAESSSELQAQVRAELPIENDWDGEGSSGYSDAVVERAVLQATEMMQAGMWQGINIDVPDFGPGPEGSVDLHWVTGNYEVLVNVPADQLALPTFYCDDHHDSRLKGTLHPVKGAAFLAAWLREHA